MTWASSLTGGRTDFSPDTHFLLAILAFQRIAPVAAMSNDMGVWSNTIDEDVVAED
jgi:hypothetical protein